MIKLRALTIEDAKITWQWRNIEEIQYFYTGHPFPVNYEKEVKWFEGILFQNVPHTYLGVEKNGKLIGITSLRNIDQLNRQAEFAILIAEGRGIGEEATMKTLTFGFQDLGLERIWLKVMDDNLSAIKLYDKCQFVREGIMRKSAFKRGKFVDQILMSMLREEFIKQL